MENIIEELKKFIEERYTEAKQTAESFLPEDDYDYDIGTCDGRMDAFQEVLYWIKRREK